MFSFSRTFRATLQPLFVGLALVLFAGVLSACSSSPANSGTSPHTSLEDPRAVLGDATPDGRGGARLGDPGTGWTVVLAVFRGDQRRAMAERLQEQIRARTPLADTFVEDRSGATIVGYGRFLTQNDPAAARALKTARETFVSGQAPFTAAFLMAPDVAVISGAPGGTTSRPDFDLARVRATIGPAARYTLQIAAYGAPDFRDSPTPAQLAEARRLAEEAVAILRRQGEQAFFYHGPEMSMVTVGIFDHDVLSRESTPEYLALKRKYPHNLYNGQGIRQRITGGPTEMQPSILVQIPDR